jgi:hypothetical protein
MAKIKPKNATAEFETPNDVRSRLYKSTGAVDDPELAELVAKEGADEPIPEDVATSTATAQSPMSAPVSEGAVTADRVARYLRAKNPEVFKDAPDDKILRYVESRNPGTLEKQFGYKPTPVASPEAQYGPKYLGGLLGGRPLNDAAKQEAYSNLSDLVFGNNMAPSMTAGGIGMNALEGIARGGRMGASGMHDLGGLVGPKTQKVADVVSGGLLPQNKLAAGMSLYGAAGEVGGGPNKFSKATGVETDPEFFHDSSKLERTKVVQPNGLEKLGGTVATATTGIPERYTQAVMADPSILDEATPGTKEVGKMYSKAFAKGGVKVNSAELEKLVGDPFPPKTDTEYGKLKDIVLSVRDRMNTAQQLRAQASGLQNKLDAFTKAASTGPGTAVTQEQAAQISEITDQIAKLQDKADKVMPSDGQIFMGRSAAAKLGKVTGPDAAGFKSVARGLQDMFDKHLENTSIPELKGLSAKYFRAVAKEYFEPLLPQNKNLSPNALRSLMVLKQGANAVGNVAQGNYGEALGNVVQGAAMSPYMVAGAIKTAQGLPSALTSGPARTLTMSALNQFGKKKEDKKN